MFYYDPSDPRIFVPKPSGLGHTLNMAHPASWAIAALVIIAIVAFSIMRRRGRKR
jgi:uncharacterized membrane protein